MAQKHNISPGNYVYVKSLSDSPLEPTWEGPYQVLLTTHTAAKVEGLILWIHHTRLKKAIQPLWTTETRGPPRVVLQRKQQNEGL